MARLWIILLVIWYHAITFARSESNLDENHIPLIFNSKEDRFNEIDGDKLKTKDESSSSQAIKGETGDNPMNDPQLSELYNYKINSLPSQCLYDLNKRKFNSWGGKRTYEEHLSDCFDALGLNMIDEDGFNRNKLSFHAWGGKRSADDQVTPKRLPFRAWGGKRDNSMDTSTPKRLPFKAWGGKRAPEEYLYPIYSIIDVPRFDEHALQYLTQRPAEPNEKRVNYKRPKFHSWGGKRSFDDGNLNNNIEEILNEAGGFGPRRLKFNSWGGKRDPDYTDMEDKRTFHSWGGKRQSNIDDIEESKRTFHSWGGK